MTKPTPPRRYHASSPFQAPPEVPVEVFEVGARVLHESFGLGRILSMHGTTSAQVDFGDHVAHVALPTRAMSNL